MSFMLGQGVKLALGGGVAFTKGAGGRLDAETEEIGRMISNAGPGMVTFVGGLARDLVGITVEKGIMRGEYDANTAQELWHTLGRTAGLIYDDRPGRGWFARVGDYTDAIREGAPISSMLVEDAGNITLAGGALAKGLGTAGRAARVGAEARAMAGGAKTVGAAETGFVSEAAKAAAPRLSRLAEAGVKGERAVRKVIRPADYILSLPIKPYVYGVGKLGKIVRNGAYFGSLHTGWGKKAADAYIQELRDLQSSPGFDPALMSYEVGRLRQKISRHQKLSMTWQARRAVVAAARKAEAEQGKQARTVINSVKNAPHANKKDPVTDVVYGDELSPDENVAVIAVINGTADLVDGMVNEFGESVENIATLSRYNDYPGYSPTPEGLNMAVRFLKPGGGGLSPMQYERIAAVVDSVVQALQLQAADKAAGIGRRYPLQPHNFVPVPVVQYLLDAVKREAAATRDPYLLQVAEFIQNNQGLWDLPVDNPVRIQMLQFLIKNMPDSILYDSSIYPSAMRPLVEMYKRYRRNLERRAIAAGEGGDMPMGPRAGKPGAAKRYAAQARLRASAAKAKIDKLSERIARLEEQHSRGVDTLRRMEMVERIANGESLESIAAEYGVRPEDLQKIYTGSKVGQTRRRYEEARDVARALLQQAIDAGVVRIENGVMVYTTRNELTAQLEAAVADAQALNREYRDLIESITQEKVAAARELEDLADEIDDTSEEMFDAEDDFVADGGDITELEQPDTSLEELGGGDLTIEELNTRLAQLAAERQQVAGELAKPAEAAEPAAPTGGMTKDEYLAALRDLIKTGQISSTQVKQIEQAFDTTYTPQTAKKRQSTADSRAFKASKISGDGRRRGLIVNEVNGELWWSDGYMAGRVADSPLLDEHINEPGLYEPVSNKIADARVSGFRKVDGTPAPINAVVDAAINNNKLVARIVGANRLSKDAKVVVLELEDGTRMGIDMEIIDAVYEPGVTMLASEANRAVLFVSDRGNVAVGLAMPIRDSGVIPDEASVIAATQEMGQVPTIPGATAGKAAPKAPTDTTQRRELQGRLKQIEVDIDETMARLKEVKKTETKPAARVETEQPADGELSVSERSFRDSIQDSSEVYSEVSRRIRVVFHGPYSDYRSRLSFFRDFFTPLKKLDPKKYASETRKKSTKQKFIDLAISEIYGILEEYKTSRYEKATYPGQDYTYPEANYSKNEKRVAEIEKEIVAMLEELYDAMVQYEKDLRTKDPYGATMRKRAEKINSMSRKVENKIQDMIYPHGNVGYYDAIFSHEEGVHDIPLTPGAKVNENVASEYKEYQQDFAQPRSATPEKIEKAGPVNVNAREDVIRALRPIDSYNAPKSIDDLVDIFGDPSTLPKSYNQTTYGSVERVNEAMSQLVRWMQAVRSAANDKQRIELILNPPEYVSPQMAKKMLQGMTRKNLESVNKDAPNHPLRKFNKRSTELLYDIKKSISTAYAYDALYGQVEYVDWTTLADHATSREVLVNGERVNEIHLVPGRVRLEGVVPGLRFMEDTPVEVVLDGLRSLRDGIEADAPINADIGEYNENLAAMRATYGVYSIGADFLSKKHRQAKSEILEQIDDAINQIENMQRVPSDEYVVEPNAKEDIIPGVEPGVTVPRLAPAEQPIARPAKKPAQMAEAQPKTPAARLATPEEIVTPVVRTVEQPTRPAEVRPRPEITDLDIQSQVFADDAVVAIAPRLAEKVRVAQTASEKIKALDELMKAVAKSQERWTEYQEALARNEKRRQGILAIPGRISTAEKAREQAEAVMQEQIAKAVAVETSPEYQRLTSMPATLPLDIAMDPTRQGLAEAGFGEIQLPDGSTVRAMGPIYVPSQAPSTVTGLKGKYTVREGLPGFIPDISERQRIGDREMIWRLDAVAARIAGTAGRMSLNESWRMFVGQHGRTLEEMIGIVNERIKAANKRDGGNRPLYDLEQMREIAYQRALNMPTMERQARYAPETLPEGVTPETFVPGYGAMAPGVVSPETNLQRMANKEFGKMIIDILRTENFEAVDPWNRARATYSDFELANPEMMYMDRTTLDLASSLSAEQNPQRDIPVLDQLTQVNKFFKSSTLALSVMWQIGDFTTALIIARLTGVNVRTLIRRMKEVYQAEYGSVKSMFDANAPDIPKTPLAELATSSGVQDVSASMSERQFLRGFKVSPQGRLLERGMIGKLGGKRIQGFADRSFKFNETINRITRHAFFLEKLDNLLRENGNTLDGVVRDGSWRSDPEIRAAVEDAAATANKWLGDFADLSIAEKRYVSLVFPFWAWTKHIHKVFYALGRDHPESLKWYIYMGTLGSDLENDPLDLRLGTVPVFGGAASVNFLNPLADVFEGPFVRFVRGEPEGLGRAAGPVPRIAGAALGIDIGRMQRLSRPAGTGMYSKTGMPKAGLGNLLDPSTYPQVAGYALQQFPIATRLAAFGPVGETLPGTTLALGPVSRYSTGEARRRGSGEIITQPGGRLGALGRLFSIPLTPSRSDEQINDVLKSAERRLKSVERAKKRAEQGG